MSEEDKEKSSSGSHVRKTKLGKVMGWLVEDPYCPVCDELGYKEELHEVTGLEDIARNPQSDKGAPRVVDCTGGCRYSLEPFYNKRADGSFCYMLISSERSPGMIVNHYWFKPDFIKPPL